MPRHSAERLVELTAEILARAGSPRAHALLVAEHLVGSNLSGHDSHGLIRLPQYCAHIREGKVDPAASPRVVRQGPTTALIDGSRAWGQVVARAAADLALALARRSAVGAVAARNSYHVGRVGAYLMPAAEAGFIAQAFCNGHGVSRAAPWGGTDSRLGTNPIAFALPARGGPILADFATTAVAEGKVRLAKAEGRAIPEGWVIDGAGRPTTDPAVLYDGGTLVPLGGREGHKGYCLSITVDILGGLLPGAGAGRLTPVVGNGLFIQVIDPRAFDDEAAFLDRVDTYVAYLKASPRRAGVDEVLLPGEPERRAEARRRREGLEIDAGTWSEIEGLAHGFGVELP
jgi:uncharacterized oxidoreductase